MKAHFQKWKNLLQSGVVFQFLQCFYPTCIMRIKNKNHESFIPPSPPWEGDVRYGCVTWTCVWVFCCVNKAQMKSWMWKWFNGWSIARIWTSRKCQKKRWLKIMKFRRCCYSLATSFLFFCCFVICKLWVLVCTFHGLDDIQHWLIWCFALYLGMMCYEGWTV
jgi:hypothetical protein